MQRKATKNTRTANAGERSYHAWLKLRDCCVCGNMGPSIVHHCCGQTYRHNKQLIGHKFCIPLCQSCDDVITYGSRRKFKEKFGLQSIYAIREISQYLLTEKGSTLDWVVEINAIEDCNE